jgi:hypothetical protein
MDFFGGSEPTILFTHLAERMLYNKSVSQSFPRPAIAFASGGVAAVAFVLAGVLFGVVFTKKAAR